ncbi:ectonucleotide pyrophosphatase/phosphodiesterase [Dyella sp. C11]|uniref:alkaline phosphatase family protein n=1 Tax=Dyella sp. C11 TaxID=2126991 RepID=UPI000D65A1CB|nr:ectonucleotide pyrophosphatase/phosphodiesterase [Dyella sp. C11]
MKILFRPLLCTLIAVAAGCATPSHTSTNTASSAPSAPKAATIKAAPAPLLLISIDGYRTDYLSRGLSPTLQSLADHGVHATDGMQPSFPSLTFPNHYTIVTGLRPDHHGIVNNTMSDPVLGKFSLGNRDAVSNGRWWSEGTPLWETVQKNGMTSATMFWPGSEADIHGEHPRFWKPYDGNVTATERVDQVLSWLDLPVAERPKFITLYFDEVDHAGHDFGPDSPQVNEAISHTDAALARLVDGLKKRGLLDRINMIVLADHGMAPAPSRNVVVVDKLIPIKHVDVVATGVLAGFNPKPGYDFARIEASLEKPQKHMTCWDKTRVPERFAYGSNPRVPQLLCLADVGWRISTSDYLAKKKKQSQGDHGYDNQAPQMQALFIAHGPAFREGAQVPSFPNVDVYPLMTHLLDVPAAQNDGDYNAVKDMLKPDAQ